MVQPLLFKGNKQKKEPFGAKGIKQDSLKMSRLMRKPGLSCNASQMCVEGRHFHLRYLLVFADDLKDKCEKLLCKCDMEAARCLRRAPFTQKYAMWPDFLCGYKQPTCNIY